MSFKRLCLTRKETKTTNFLNILNDCILFSLSQHQDSRPILLIIPPYKMGLNLHMFINNKTWSIRAFSGEILDMVYVKVI